MKEVKLSDQYKVILRDQEYMFELMRKDKKCSKEDLEEIRNRIEKIKKEIAKAKIEETKGRNK